MKGVTSELVPQRETSSPTGRTLRVICFGSFLIAGRDGWESGPEPKRARELVQYLIVHPRGVAPRERLTEVLWPGRSSEAQHRLHSAVSDARVFLRHILTGFDAIRCSSEGYCWHPDVRIVSDVADFVERYRDGTLAAMRDAVEIYAGELFEGHDAEWLQPERVKYASMYASMVERLAVEAFDNGSVEQALHFALELLGIDRAHEGASRLVMRCFGALGQRARAAHEYETLSAYLHKHLSADPMPETTAVIQGILGRSGTSGP